MYAWGGGREGTQGYSRDAQEGVRGEWGTGFARDEGDLDREMRQGDGLEWLRDV